MLIVLRENEQRELLALFREYKGSSTIVQTITIAQELVHSVKRLNGFQISREIRVTSLATAAQIS